MKKLLLILLSVPLFLYSQHTIKDPDSGVISKYAYDGQILERYKLDNNGKYHGKYEEWWSTGERYSVQGWKHGREFGKQEFWFKDGSLYMRYYVDDNTAFAHGMYGEFIKYFENRNQQYYTIRDRNGYKIGADKEWFENGQLKENYNYDRESRRHGKQREWTEDGNLVLLQHYNHGKKDGEWRKYSNDGVLHSVENWRDDKAHGEFILYDSIWSDYHPWPIFVRNYKYGKKDGVWIEYHKEDENSEDPTFRGMYKYQTWKDDRLHGIFKQWGDECYEDDNNRLESYLEMPKYNLVLEGNYNNGEKDGIFRKWWSGTYYENEDETSREWREGYLISEENYIDRRKDGICKYYDYQGDLEKELVYLDGHKQEERLFKDGILMQESIFTEEGRIVLKARDSRGWISINYGGKCLNYTVFQDEEHISVLDASINTGENIILEYKKNVIYHTDEIERNEQNKIKYESKTDSLNLVLSKYRKKKGEKKIAKILDKQENQEKIKKRSLAIIQRINFLEEIVDSFSIILEDCNQESFHHNILLSHYSMNIPFVEQYIQKKSIELENEKSKDIYDLKYEYPEELYMFEYVSRLGDDVSSIPISFLINNGSVGPFRLGMTDADLLELFNSDLFFHNVDKRMNNDYNESTCAIPCDFRIDTIYDYNYYYEKCRKEFYRDPDNRDENPDEACGWSDYESDFWNRLGVSQDGKAYRFKYEFIKQNGEWIRGYFIFCSNNDTIHTICFDAGNMNEESETSNFFISKNGIHNYMFFEDLIELNEEYNEVDVFKMDSSNIEKYYFYDKTSLSYIYIYPQYFTNTGLESNGRSPITEVCKFFINGFKITNRDDLQLNPSTLINGSSIIKLQESLIQKRQEIKNQSDGQREEKE